MARFGNCSRGGTSAPVGLMSVPGPPSVDRFVSSRRLDGKSILVTGGSSGLGRAMSIAFASEGARVTVADVRSEPRSGGQPTHELIQSRGLDASFVRADVSRWADVDQAVQQALGSSGRIDVLVNSAVRVGNH